MSTLALLDLTSLQCSGDRLEADRLTMMRRDYGATPKGQPFSKVQERLLREKGVHLPQRWEASAAQSCLEANCKANTCASSTDR